MYLSTKTYSQHYNLFYDQCFRNASHSTHPLNYTSPFHEDMLSHTNMQKCFSQ